MLVIKVEIWPHGDETLAREIGSMTISNVTYNDDPSDYAYKVNEPRSAFNPVGTEELGMVRNHHRYQSVWKLIRRVLEQIP